MRSATRNKAARDKADAVKAAGEKRADGKRTYRFSTIIALVFLLAMLMISGLVVVASYWGVKDIVDYNITRLSERTQDIARLIFQDYLRSAEQTVDIVSSSAYLVAAIDASDKEWQREILSDIYETRQEGHLDLFMFQIGYDSEIVDVSATAYDIRGLRRAVLSLPRARFTSMLVMANGESEMIYAVVNKEPVLSKTGRVVGNVYAGVILNDNIELLSRILSGTRSDALEISYQGWRVSALKSSEQEVRAQPAGQKGDDLQIVTELDVATSSGAPLVLKIDHPLYTIRLLENRYVQAIYDVVIFIVIVIALSIALLNRVVFRAVQPLAEYAAAARKDRSSACFRGSSVTEFNKVGQTLDHLIGEMIEAEDEILRSNADLKRMAMMAAHSKERLKKTNADLESANAELEEFAYRTSHDLRAPLVSSLSLVEMIEDSIQEKDNEAALKSLSYVKKSLSQLEILIKDILILNEVRYKEEENQNLDIQAMIAQSLESLSYVKGYDKVKIIKNLTFDGPLYSKETRLKMIIDNLLSNAVKYHDPEKAQPYVEISTRRDNDNFVLSVKDNGVGIPPDKEEKLFEMFQRFHPRHSFGSGLGLYLVKKSAAALHGDVRFKRHKDGSVFELVLPLEKANLSGNSAMEEGETS